MEKRGEGNSQVWPARPTPVRPPPRGSLFCRPNRANRRSCPLGGIFLSASPALFFSRFPSAWSAANPPLNLSGSVGACTSFSPAARGTFRSLPPPPVLPRFVPSARPRPCLPGGSTGASSRVPVVFPVSPSVFRNPPLHARPPPASRQRPPATKTLPPPGIQPFPTTLPRAP